MKILFFTYDFPFPTTSGGKTRSYNLLKFGKKDAEIVLFSFVRDSFKEEDKDGLKKIGIDKIKLFKRKKAKDIRNIPTLFNFNSSIFKHLYFDKDILDELERTIKEEKIDIVHLESFYTSFYIQKELKKYGVKFVFGTENIEHKLYEDYARYLSPFPLKPFYFFESKKIKREEEYFLRQADAVVTVLESEAKYIESITSSPCHVVENGVDLENFKFKKRAEKKEKNILFVGNFSYFPNIEAVNFFYSKVFKNLGENMIFTIVGTGVNKLTFIKDERVKLIDYVKNIRDVYYDADAFVFPVRFGGGTNFKLLEAMATGLPIVASEERIKDLNLIPEKDILTARNSEEFKNQIIKLFSSEKLKDNITNNARKIVEEKYAWDKIGSKMNKVWENVNAAKEVTVHV